MAVTHTWTNTVKVPGLATMPADPPVLVTGDYASDVEVAVAAGATVEVDIGTVVAAKIVSFVMHSDQAGVTVNTNASDATGGQTFALGAAKALGWNNTLTFANPLTIDVSKFFITNAAAKATTFRFGALLQS